MENIFQKYSLKLKKGLSILSKKNIKLKHFSHQSFPTPSVREAFFLSPLYQMIMTFPK
ncbi:hypothetical protein HMPREF1242_1438 [Streptococcus pyogenes GA40884]|nr:hypothetical protein HMPREF1242_1438 [Streptococcus pyogenes GA40884]